MYLTSLSKWRNGRTPNALVVGQTAAELTFSLVLRAKSMLWVVGDVIPPLLAGKHAPNTNRALKPSLQN